ncbi:MAG: hypothetical protein C5B59_20035 [Bacteroidetes bacterium]|nr:MAG: hypothetical protein C5B59_20035 [Bacteroidota bacterium]
MLKKIELVILLLALIIQLDAQTGKDPLFDDQRPLNIALTVTNKELKKAKEDSVYIGHMLFYKDAEGNADSVKVGLKGRGNFRLNQCYFIPLKIKIKKKDAKGTLFEGNKKLKLVLPCLNQRSKDILIVRELICYKLYEEVTDYAFRTRLINLDITELRGKKSRNFQTKGILVEDLDKLAKRFDAKPVKNSLRSSSFQDTASLRFDFFQLMISNTDWSKSFQHNAKVIYHQLYYIPIPYDFDMAGLVDAPYSTVSQINGEQLPISSVRERLYRGDCRPKELTEFVRREFISKKARFLAIPSGFKSELPDRDVRNMEAYLNDFFKILENDRVFAREVAEICQALN